MARNNQTPGVVEVMPEGFTYDEAFEEAMHLLSLGKVGVDAEVEVESPEFVTLSTEESTEVTNG